MLSGRRASPSSSIKRRESRRKLLITFAANDFHFSRGCMRQTGEGPQSVRSLNQVFSVVTVTDMFLEADDALFRKILYDKAHVLHSFCLIDLTLSTRFVPVLVIRLSCVKPVTSTNATF